MFFRDKKSIKNKLTLLISSIAASVLLAGLIIAVSITVALIKREKVETARSMVNIIGDYIVPALAFDYPERGREIVERLKNDPAVLACYIFTDEGKLFASYNRDYRNPEQVTCPTKNITQFRYKHFQIQQKISNDDIDYGWIVLNIRSNIPGTVGIVVIITGILTVLLTILAVVLANRFQKIISSPILRLSEAARRISETGVYSLRLKKISNDEIGQLYDEFNNMLEIVETRRRETEFAEQRLREREIWFKSILNSLNDAVFIHDIETAAILDANNRACDLYGYSYDRMLNLTIGEISSGKGPYNQQTANEAIRFCSRQGSLVKKWQAKNSNGEVFWAEVNMRKAVLGGKDRVIAVIRDVDQRVKQERELNDLRNYLKDVIDSMPSSIVGVDEKGMVTQWNKEAELLSGIPSEFAAGKLFSLVMPQLSQIETEIRAAIENRHLLRNERIRYPGDKDDNIYDVTTFPLSMNNGTGGAVIRVDNVTQKVHIEQMMIQSEKMLSVGGLAAGMAHEINNPLAGIVQNIQVVENRLVKPLPANLEIAEKLNVDFATIVRYIEERDILSSLESMREAGSRAAKIVRDMLDFSRMSVDGSVRCDIAVLLDKTLEIAANDYDLKKQYDFRQIKIERQYDPESPQVYCDPSKIQQVFLNVLKNGAQAMGETRRERPPQFNLTIKPQDKWLVMEIEDNGPGIKKSIVNRIFEPFFTTKEVGQGTGLGLSVSYFIIKENHKGQMLVESEPGIGTRFIIKLPIYEGDGI